jgi:hypothetical protein
MRQALHGLARVFHRVLVDSRTRFVLIVGLIDRDRPVHASKARLWATIQSTDPLTFTTANEVLGDRTETRAVTGVAEETWEVLMAVFQAAISLLSRASYLLVEKGHSDNGPPEGF